jgi:hypothetical protein
MAAGELATCPWVDAGLPGKLSNIAADHHFVISRRNIDVALHH